MVSWSRPLEGTRSHRHRLVMRARAERVASVAAIIAAIVASMAAALPLALGLAIGLASLWLVQPVVGCVILSRRRCRISDVVMRAVSLLASAAHRVVSPVDGTADLMQSAATNVALASADDRFVCAVSAITTRLHGIPHACVLRARLTAAVAAGC